MKVLSKTKYETKTSKCNYDTSDDDNDNGVRLSRTTSQMSNFKLLQIYQFL